METFMEIATKMVISGALWATLLAISSTYDLSRGKFIKWFLIWLVSMFFIFIWAYYSTKRRKNKEEDERIIAEEMEVAQNKISAEKAEANLTYLRIMEETRIPSDATEVSSVRKSDFLSPGLYYMWLNRDNLYFFPKEHPITFSLDVEENVKSYQIALSDIEYFTSQGEIYRETQIVGGGGGGSSLGGAIIGGVIAGDAGAIIGSRKAGNPITSTLVTHDEREVVFYYCDNEVTKELSFQIDSLRAFEKLIPDKSYEVVTSIKRMNIIKNHDNEVNLTSTPEKTRASSIPDSIRDLSKLRDEGILTEEEFMAKKKELLAQMN